MQRLTKFAVAWFIALFSAGATAEPPIPVDAEATEPVLLRYLFEQGAVDTYRIEVEHRLTVQGNALEQPAVTTARMVIDTEQTVIELIEGGAGRLRQRITGSTVNLSVNETSVPADDVALTLNGLTMTFDMTSRGAVSNTLVEDTEDQQLAQMFSLLEDSIRHTTIEFPEGTVAVGEQWNQDLPVDLEQPGMQFDTRISATYTFLGYATVDEARCAVIQSDLVVSLSGSFTDAGLQTTAEGTGTGIGYSYFDSAAGEMARGSMDITLQTQLSAEGMDFEQSLTMTMNVLRL